MSNEDLLQAIVKCYEGWDYSHPETLKEELAPLMQEAKNLQQS